LLDLQIHDEDVRWLLQAMATLGGFKAELDADVKGPVRFRIRADSYADAFQEIVKKAGFSTTKIEGGFSVKKK
ncbi:MAG: hypothetical protein ACYTHN_25090, partial [Planctomycetota bacterium]